MQFTLGILQNLNLGVTHLGLKLFKCWHLISEINLPSMSHSSRIHEHVQYQPQLTSLKIAYSHGLEHVLTNEMAAL